MGNTSTQFITIYNIDNTAPTITDVDVSGSTVTITANDEHDTLGEGSGIVGYLITEDSNTPTDGWQTSNAFTITNSGTYYAWAIDAAGNISKRILLYV